MRSRDQYPFSSLRPIQAAGEALDHGPAHSSLPAFSLQVYEKTKDQFEVVRKILCSSRVGHVICATDAGREWASLIFRYIYESGSVLGKPISRL